MILDAGRINVGRLLGGDTTNGKKITKIAFGTSDAPVTGAEFALTGEVQKTITGVNYVTSQLTEFQTTLLSGDPAMIIREMGLYNEANVLVHRKVITPKEKVAGVTYAAAYRVKVI